MTFRFCTLKTNEKKKLISFFAQALIPLSPPQQSDSQNATIRSLFGVWAWADIPFELFGLPLQGVWCGSNASLFFPKNCLWGCAVSPPMWERSLSSFVRRERVTDLRWRCSTSLMCSFQRFRCGTVWIQNIRFLLPSGQEGVHLSGIFLIQRSWKGFTQVF